jgi:hypothetical protein
MIAWVDENGGITSTPPDLTHKKEIKAENIEIGVPKAEFRINNKIRTEQVGLRILMSRKVLVLLLTLKQKIQYSFMQMIALKS